MATWTQGERAAKRRLEVGPSLCIRNNKSGWKALTGTTDFGEISSSSDPRCKPAVDILVDRIVGFVGSYYVKLEGKIDALVFAGGIGENGTVLRTRVVQQCNCLGFEVDARMKSQNSLFPSLVLGWRIRFATRSLFP